MKVMKEGTLDAKQQLNEVAQTSEPTLLGMTPDHPTEKPQLLMPTEVSPSWNSLMVEPPTSRRSSLGVYVENLPSSLESIHSEFEPPTEAQSSPVWTPVSEVSADIEVLGVKKFNLEDSLEELLQNLERFLEASLKSEEPAHLWPRSPWPPATLRWGRRGRTFQQCLCGGRRASGGKGAGGRGRLETFSLPGFDSHFGPGSPSV
uniref:Uncharacterized protein isoform X5 n=1 Tax=Pogona vitticeps TaxID=103695 RepID=A0ABM5EVU5_9SAUR